MITDWDELFAQISRAVKEHTANLPSVSQIAQTSLQDPFRVLISTIISLRTKDEVTIAASKRLFSLATDPFTMVTLDIQAIEQAIYPAGFYRNKAKHIVAISSILIDRYEGNVPPDRNLLMKLPGVGPNTANLTLNLGFGIDAICVDTHVHRFSNRLGWVTTDSPEKTEKALESVMPRRFWIPLNELLVTFGQNICNPVSPKCSICPLEHRCPKIGVGHHR